MLIAITSALASAYIGLHSVMELVVKDCVYVFFHLGLSLKVSVYLQNSHSCTIKSVITSFSFVGTMVVKGSFLVPCFESLTEGRVQIMSKG